MEHSSLELILGGTSSVFKDIAARGIGHAYTSSRAWPLPFHARACWRVTLRMEGSCRDWYKIEIFVLLFRKFYASLLAALRETLS